MAEISRYGAYLPKYRAPLGEIQKFFGRPGRPRAKTLSTPALDEDALTMAYEAADQALGDGPPAGRADRRHAVAAVRAAQGVVDPGRGPRALGRRPRRTTSAAIPGSLSDAFALAEALVATAGSVLVVASDYVVSFEEQRLRHARRAAVPRRSW